MELKDEATRIALIVDGVEAGEITWSPAGEGLWIIDHTFVDDNFRGKGYADTLVKAAVERARREEKKILPLCPFAKKVIHETPEYQDVLNK